MRILIRLDAARVSAWHRRLAETYRAQGHEAGVALAAGQGRLPASISALLRLEAALRGHAGQLRLAAPEDGQALQRDFPAPPAPDLVLDLSGTAAPPPPGACVLTFDGHAGESHAVARLLEGGTPRLAIRDAAGAESVAGLPALGQRSGLADSLEALAARCLTVCRLLPERLASGLRADAPSPPPAQRPSAAQAAQFAFGRLRARLAGRLARLSGGAAQWRIGWERDGAAPFRPEGDRVPGAFSLLPDDGRRFFADPIGIVVDGTLHVFCEELPFETGRGRISHFTLDANGRASPTRPVLEEPHHLSYPFLFSHEGQIYMLPEAHASGRLTLYRADPFPHRFVPDRVLVEAPLADATLCRHGGRWWLFATGFEGGTTDWDCLELFHAPSPLGPFRPLAGNPVMIDARAARPAGPMFEHEGRLIRPVQDCSQRYGGGLAFAEVTQLGEEGFAQRLLGRLLPPAGADGLHSFQRIGGFTLFDLHAPP